MMSITRIVTVALVGFMAIGSTACMSEANFEGNESLLQEENSIRIDIVEEENLNTSEHEQSSEISIQQGNRAYNYSENDGIFVFYETENDELYRKLLPEEFDMPDRLVVHLFVMDFYEIDSDADPYKEMSISLLAKHNDEDIWHCIYMPVTSEQSMVAGKVALGLPKTIGDIQFIRDDMTYTGTVVDDQNRSGSILLNTAAYSMSLSEEEQIKTFMSIPKINLLNGEAVQMTRAGGAVNIIDVSKRYPDSVDVQGGVAKISFDMIEGSSSHPFDLEPTTVIAAYYLHNEIPFSLDRK